MRVRVGLLVASAAAWACHPSPRAQFDDEVAPVLAATCGSTRCHGVERGAERRGEHIDWARFFFYVEDGAVDDLPLAYRQAKRRITTTDAASFSTLLRKPTPRAYGGLSHYGGESFASPRVPAYRAIERWIARERGGGEDEPPLTPSEQAFAERVQPHLAAMSCATANCHGPSSAIPFRLDPGVGGVMSRAATRANYEASLRMVSLDGDPLQSRLLRKALPLGDGGVAHKGGNVSFLRGRADPRVRDVVAWVCGERLRRLGLPCEEAGARPEELVFVRGPLAPADPFALDVFVPGTDLYLARLDADLGAVDVENLTAGLHDGAADVRDPALDPSGRTLFFAMRRSASVGHELWQLDLTTRQAQQLTASVGALPGGIVATDREPTAAPDGTALWFVSNRAGVLSERGRLADAELYELDLASGATRRRTFTPHVERKPTFLVAGESSGEVAFTSLRDVVGGAERAHPFRFPPGLATEYHQHFGITPPEDLFDDMRELPDGRFVLVVGDLANAWPMGRLGIVDRNFGPELASGAEAPASVPHYAPPLARLDPGAASRGVTAAAYADPAPLPDGRLLVTLAPGPLDLADSGALPDTRIEVLTLAESPRGDGPAIRAAQTVVDEPGVADFDPEPVYPRYLPSDPEVRWDPSATTGVVRHNGLAVIDAILAALEPTGAKPIRQDQRYVRLVEAVPARADQRAPIALPGEPHATTTGIGALGPSRVLAELPLATDSSFHVEVPAGVAVRMQGLDARGVAVGVVHNRWFDVSPGQTLSLGVSSARPDVYARLCAACHGALDGDPAHAVTDVDAVTSASLTASRFAGQDPRRPLPPARAGDETRREVDFVIDVQPILSRRCATGGCHVEGGAGAALVLDGEPTRWFSRSYEALLARGEGSYGARRYVDAERGTARGSFLVETLLGRELEAPRALARQGVRHPSDDHGVVLPDDELWQLLRWTDLGAPYRTRLLETP